MRRAGKIKRARVGKIVCVCAMKGGARSEDDDDKDDETEFEEEEEFTYCL